MSPHALKLIQLRFFREVVDNDFNVSRAAAALHTSQPGVSRHLQLLEQSLGVVLLNRQNTRIVGLTDAGAALLPAVRQVLTEADNLQRQAREIAAPAKTKFVIATTHTHARHTLLPVLKTFMDTHPRIALQLRQGSVPRISQLLRDEIVDIGVSTDPVDHEGLALLPCYRYTHSLITPPGHALLKEKRITLERLAQFPLITYDERHRLGRLVREEFASSRLEPNIVMSIIDDDIMKAYVEAGFGVAIMATMAFDPARDRGVRAIPLDHLFEPSTCYVMTKERRYLERHIQDFIALVKSAQPGEAPARRGGR
ncbi:MAG TPA: LysR substrate-binding domain-containing protein [Burkholderiales bacterium]|nr:LysR substrate-binding domain-containing protein [Burkholderiales bacterium]